MKRVLLPIPVIAALWFAGCSSPSQPSQPNQVNYNKGTSYTYKDNQLDANDTPQPATTDTITSRVAATGMTYQGMTNVTMLVNSHSTGAADDTTYIAQNAGSFYHYNYGLEAINNNAAVLAKIGSPVQIGWVLQTKFGATNGDKWTARDTTVLIQGFSTNVNVQAAEQADTNITVQGASVTAKHTVHTITLMLGGTIKVATSNVDTYVSPSVGVTVNIVHSTTVSIPGTYSGPVSGRETVLLSHQ